MQRAFAFLLLAALIVLACYSATRRIFETDSGTGLRRMRTRLALSTVLALVLAVFMLLLALLR